MTGWAMSKNSDNRRRAFADVVTIEAWHDEFDDGHPKADLHTDVVFGTARVGGEPESPVRFRLSVRRAEVVVIIPELEPVSVDKASVSRDSPELEGRLTKVVEKKNQAHAKGSLSGAMARAGLRAEASAEVGAEASVSASEKLEVSATVQFVIVTQSKTSEGHYRWSVEPRASQVLKGRPWDPVNQPRLKLIDKRKDRSAGIPPAVRVEVRCRREDLDIDRLEIKDENLWETVKRRAGFQNRMAAAESYNRDRLLEEGLDVRNIGDMFGELTLGSAIAETG